MKIKICGLNPARDVQLCIDLKINYLGFVFYEKSPRNVSLPDIKILSKYNKKMLETELNSYLSEYYGKLKIKTDIKSWDLSLVKANKFFDTRILLIGDAAHSIHPLAGQGLNLTLKGIEIFYKLSKNKSLKEMDIGSDKILNAFSKKQYLNTIAIIFATDKLNFLFSNSNFFLKKIREIGLYTFKRSNFLKNIFKNYASEGKFSIK